MVDHAHYDEFYVEAKNSKIMRDDLHDQKKGIQIAVSKVLNETYLAISEDSQYVYLRNYMKRIVIFIHKPLELPKDLTGRHPGKHPPAVDQKGL